LAFLGGPPLIAGGTNKIEGAFGIILGERVEDIGGVHWERTPSGEEMYKFIPKIPHDLIKAYHVLITPRTTKVCCVWGLGQRNKQREAVKSEEEIFVKILTEKYGAAEPEPVPNLDETRTIDQGDRLVTLHIAEPDRGVYQLDLRYVDTALGKKAKEEMTAPRFPR
jgi:hypothetical protein